MSDTWTLTRGQTVRTMATDLIAESCCACGVWFAMTKPFRDARLRDGKWFYCPAGHEQHYTETDTTRLRKAEAIRRTPRGAPTRRRSDHRHRQGARAMTVRDRSAKLAGLNVRITRAHADLARYTDASNRACSRVYEAERGLNLQSPAGRQQVQYTHPSPFAANLTHESRMPAGGDPELRAAVIRSAQRLADAIRTLMAWDWDDVAWAPTDLAHTVERTIGGRTVRLIACHPDGRPCWRDPDDLLTPLPPDVQPGVSQLRGMLARLEPLDWDAQDDADRDVLAAALRFIDDAIGALKWHGVWARPKRMRVTKICSREKCWNEVGERRGSVCQACVQRDYRERMKAS